MDAIDEGTKEWKVQLGDIALRHLRALDPIFQAYRYLTKLLQEEDTLDEVVKSALFVSAVVHYARPFIDNRGGKTTGAKYRIQELKNPEFDRLLHDHLLVLRQKLVAHQDGTVMRARIGHQRIKIHEHDIEIPVQTFACVGALDRIATKEMIARYLKHVKACVGAIQTNIDRALTAVDAAEHEYPEVQPEGRQKIDLFSQEPLADGEQFMLSDLADCEAAMIKLPDFPVPPNSYVWRRTMIQLTPERKYEWTTPEGAAALIVKRRSP